MRRLSVLLVLCSWLAMPSANAQSPILIGDISSMIDAAEGLSIDHPLLGTLTVRQFDHQ